MKRLLKSAARVFGGVAALVVLIWVAVAQPSCRGNAESGAMVSPDALREHVEALSVRFHPRDWGHPENLERSADYIAGHFGRAGAAVESQPVLAGGTRYRNVIGRFGPAGGSRIVVGAHYDAYEELPGADDNASGVAVLIELAALLGAESSPPAVDLVAYTLEEPPVFGSDQMGSAVHARSVGPGTGTVRGVIVLEMVGYFVDEWGSQTYPVPLLSLMYPSRGNYVAVVSRWDQGHWIKSVKCAMKGTTGLPVFSLRAPEALPGIDFSDHRNYWPHGIPSLMVTDTAFYRNKAYHSAGDRADRLDYKRMSQVAVAVYAAVRSL